MMTMSPPLAIRRSHSYLLQSIPEQAEIRLKRETLPDQHSTILGHTDLLLQPRDSRWRAMPSTGCSKYTHSAKQRLQRKISVTEVLYNA